MKKKITRAEFLALVLEDAKKSAGEIEEFIQATLANFLKKKNRALSLACSLAARWEETCAEASGVGNRAEAARHCACAKRMRKLEKQLDDLACALRNDPFKELN